MKMLSPAFLALAVLFAQGAHATVSEWGQCGGSGYSGDTVCAAGLSCVAQNAYYSQCLKSTTSTTSVKPTSTTTSKPISSTTSKPVSTTTSKSVSSTTTSKPSSTSTASPPAATGFVKTSGQRFTLNGSIFTPVGSNSYWVGLMNYSTAQMNQAFADIAKTGATVVRTWGFNDVTATQDYPYYQVWNGATPSVNTGSNGLQNFDNVVAAAKANGIHLIVALTNNWGDYGGMDVYVKQILGSANHDLFYTDAKVIAAYKSYINTFVTRYKNEPTIMGWELANEPRCKGSTGTTSGSCTTTTITNWAKDISAYIKSVDSNHLVALGDEGFYNQPGASTYPYQGGEGIDFDANLAISTLDFGTFHSYPESWGQAANATAWGTQWIADHAASQKAKNKPVIIEEFGVVAADQKTTYTAWLNEVVSSGLTGDLIWQAASHFSTGDTPDDGYGIFPDDPVYALLTSHAAALKARG